MLNQSFTVVKNRTENISFEESVYALSNLGILKAGKTCQCKYELRESKSAILLPVEASINNLTIHNNYL